MHQCITHGAVSCLHAVVHRALAAALVLNGRATPRRALVIASKGIRGAALLSRASAVGDCKGTPPGGAPLRQIFQFVCQNCARRRVQEQYIVSCRCLGQQVQACPAGHDGALRIDPLLHWSRACPLQTPYWSAALRDAHNIPRRDCTRILRASVEHMHVPYMPCVRRSLCGACV